MGYEDAGKLRPIVHRMSLVRARMHWHGIGRRRGLLSGSWWRWSVVMLLAGACASKGLMSLPPSACLLASACCHQVEIAVPYSDPNAPYTRKCAFDVGGG